MSAIDLNKVLGLVERAAFKGYYDAGTGYIYPDFKPKAIKFISEISDQISGATITPEMALVKAYNFGIESYLEKTT